MRLSVGRGLSSGRKIRKASHLPTGGVCKAFPGGLVRTQGLPFKGQDEAGFLADFARSSVKKIG